MKHGRIWGFTVGVLSCASLACWGQEKRKVIVDQDAMGPAGTDCQSILEMVQSPAVDVLGITVVTGDGWRDKEVAHTLRLLEWIGRTDIPVVPGAAMVKVIKAEYLVGITKVYVVQQTNAAGTRFVEVLLQRLREIGWTGEVRILSLSPHKDPSDLYCAAPEGFKSTFQAALDAAVEAEKWKAPKDATTGSVWDAIEGAEPVVEGSDVRKFRKREGAGI